MSHEIYDGCVLCALASSALDDAIVRGESEEEIRAAARDLDNHAEHLEVLADDD